ncbi:MAG: hypothetical protein LBH04_01885 [Tannerellaceae bacterium]|jgi:AMP nucleosidase|nr:hypothetical protein [Tannerellaceae bacterium]
MKTKQEFVDNWLPCRYTERQLHEFTEYALLKNLTKYIELFTEHFLVEIWGHESSMNAFYKKVIMIYFCIGSANATIIMDLLSAVTLKVVLFLGKCGGLKKGQQRVGDLRQWA